MAIAYSRAGGGEPLVLIHGLGGSRRIWDAGNRPAGGRARRRRGRPAGVRRVAAAARRRRPDRRQPRRRRRRALRRARARAPPPRRQLTRRLGGARAREGRQRGICLRALARRPLATAARPSPGGLTRLGPAAAVPAAAVAGLRPRPPPLSAATSSPDPSDSAEPRRRRSSTTGWAPPDTTPPTTRCAPTSSSTLSGSRRRRRSPGAPRTGSSGRPRRERMPPGARYVELEGVGHTPTWDDPPLIAELLLRGERRGSGRVGAFLAGPGAGRLVEALPGEVVGERRG